MMDVDDDQPPLASSLSLSDDEENKKPVLDEGAMIDEALNKLHLMCCLQFSYPRSHVRSFDRFAKKSILEIVAQSEVSTCVVNGFTQVYVFDNVRIGTAAHCDKTTRKWFRLTPSMAHRNNLTYHFGVFARVRHIQVPTEEDDFFTPVQMQRLQRTKRRDRFWNVKSNAEWCRLIDQEGFEIINYDPKTLIATMPSMVGAAGCSLHRCLLGTDETFANEGGNLCISGTNKIIPPLRNVAWNIEYLTDNEGRSGGQYKYEMRCSHESRKHNSTATMRMYLTTHKKKKPLGGFSIKVQIPFIGKLIPAAAIFFALGFSDEDIYHCIRVSGGTAYRDEVHTQLITSLLYGCRCVDEEQALVLIAEAAGKSSGDTPEEIQAQKLSYARHTVKCELFPQIEDRRIKGIKFSQMCWRLLDVATNKDAKLDERDHFIFRRFETPGTLIASLMRQVYVYFGKQTGNSMRRVMDKRIKDKQKKIDRLKDTLADKYPDDDDDDDDDETMTDGPKKELVARIKGMEDSFMEASVRETLVTECVSDRKISSRITYSAGTGQWSAKRGPTGRVNVSQALNSLSPLGRFCHFTRYSSTVNADQKNTLLRFVNQSDLGRQCPNESPESKQIGLVNHSSLLAELVPGSSPAFLRELLMAFALEFGLMPMSMAYGDGENNKKNDGKLSLVEVGGRLIGCTDDPEHFCATFRSFRSASTIDQEASVSRSFKPGTITILCDRDRNVRPLVRVDKLPLLYSLLVQDNCCLFTSVHYLRRLGIIEMIDASEELDCVVAMDHADMEERLTKCPGIVFTHIDIDPSLMFGLSVGLIPYSNMNQTPRNSYQGAMGKQAVDHDMYLDQEMNTTRHRLMFCQKPLVSTRVAQSLQGRLCNSSQTAMVAFATFLGINREDSIIMNQHSVDRGFGVSDYSRVYKSTQESHGSSTNRQMFEVPTRAKCVGMKVADYSKLNVKTGCVEVGKRIKSGDAVIGKTSHIRPVSTSAPAHLPNNSLDKKRRCISIIHHGPDAVVTSVVVSTNAQGNEIRKVKVTSIRIPMQADKFSSRHAQKGTIAQLISPENLPFFPVYTDKFGVQRGGHTVDIFINTHALPGRMTLAMLAEMMAGNAAVADAEFEPDGTPFRKKCAVVESMEVLRRRGFTPSGKKMMICGMTGEPIEALIFSGPCAYQKLKHMVRDKMAARGTGPVNTITRQPVEGRSRLGGLRFGEMERDALNCHGVATILLNQLREASDITVMYICSRCSLPAIGNNDIGRSMCNLCQEGDAVVAVTTVHAFALLWLELASMGVIMKLNVSEIDEESTRTSFFDLEIEKQRLVEEGGAESEEEKKEPQEAPTRLSDEDDEEDIVTASDLKSRLKKKRKKRTKLQLKDKLKRRKKHSDDSGHGQRSIADYFSVPDEKPEPTEMELRAIDNARAQVAPGMTREDISQAASSFFAKYF
jgi:DNA-directed RNA polymerase beta subunit